MRQMFATVLHKKRYHAKNAEEPILDLAKLTVQLEEEIYRRCGPDSRSSEYKSKVRYGLHQRLLCSPIATGTLPL